MPIRPPHVPLEIFVDEILFFNLESYVNGIQKVSWPLTNLVNRDIPLRFRKTEECCVVAHDRLTEPRVTME